MEISNKVFFITGGAQGIGRAIAEAALKRGGKVFIADINTEVGEETQAALQKEYGEGNVRFGRCDVTDKDQFTAIFKSAVTNFGHIDVMMNNAGIMNEKTWERAIAINYNGVIWGTNLAIEHMRKDKGGRGGLIINTASLVGVVPCMWVPIYTGTKHAVVGFTRSWASNPKISSMGIRLACFCPSIVDTNLVNIKQDECHDADGFLAYFNFIGLLPVSAVSEAFMKLVQDEDNNGKLMVMLLGSDPFYTKQVLDPPVMFPTPEDKK